jgi:hypothetical protein
MMAGAALETGHAHLLQGVRYRLPDLGLGITQVQRPEGDIFKDVGRKKLLNTIKSWVSL